MREDALAATADAVRAAYGKVTSAVADLAVAARCPAVVSTALATWGPLDVLFNNADVARWSWATPSRPSTSITGTSHRM